MLGVLIWSKPEFCTGGIGSKFAGFSTDRSMSFRDMLSFLLVEEVHIYIYIYAVGYGVVTYPKIFQCWRRSSRCTCTIAQFRCSKLPLKFLHARTCRILSVFGYRVLDTWFEGKRVLGIKTHACVQKTYMDTHAVVAPAFTYANKLEGFARLTKALVLSDFVKPLQLHGF